LPKPGQAQAVQIHIDPIRIGLRYPVSVGLIGDARSTLRSLRPKLRRHEDRSFLEQAQKTHRDWQKLMEKQRTRADHPMKPQVKNNSLGQIKWEQVVFLGNPEYGCDLQPIDFAAFARARGGKGYTIERASECASVLEQALAEPGPVIVEAIVDPNEPPIPAKVTLDHAKKFTESLVHGTSHWGKIALTVLSDKIRELI